MDESVCTVPALAADALLPPSAVCCVCVRQPQTAHTVRPRRNQRRSVLPRGPSSVHTSQTGREGGGERGSGACRARCRSTALHHTPSGKESRQASGARQPQQQQIVGRKGTDGGPPAHIAHTRATNPRAHPRCRAAESASRAKGGQPPALPSSHSGCGAGASAALPLPLPLPWSTASAPAPMTGREARRSRPRRCRSQRVRCRSQLSSMRGQQGQGPAALLQGCAGVRRRHRWVVDGRAGGATGCLPARGAWAARTRNAPGWWLWCARALMAGAVCAKRGGGWPFVAVVSRLRGEAATACRVSRLHASRKRRIHGRVTDPMRRSFQNSIDFGKQQQQLEACC
jgi:hypothetical protein